MPPDGQPSRTQSGSSFSIPVIIQTYAPINPGNSGRPILNLVVGLNTATYSTIGAYSGIGFAVPSNIIKKIVPSLIAKGSYQHPGADITPHISNALGLDLDQAK